MRLHFGVRSTQSDLPENVFGLSRFVFDRFLFEKAIATGATITRQRLEPLAWAGSTRTGCEVLAIGRKPTAAVGDRMFGFKAHFEGPANDYVEMFFFRCGYVGVSAIENGITNVCGLAPEHVLRAVEFHLDDLLASWTPLAERLRPLSRRSRWYTVAPLMFGRHACLGGPRLYPAGDALGFIDPFTGLGLVTALSTGRLAGLAATRRKSVESHLLDCHRFSHRSFCVASIFRAILGSRLAEILGPLIPGRYLFELLRPGL
jgi:hypothetical protein